MPIQGLKCKCGEVTFEKAQECLKSGRGKELGCIHSFIAIESMEQEFGKDRPSQISVTQIQEGDWGCHRAVYLQRRFPFYIEPSNYYRPWRGTSFHKILTSTSQKDSIKECRVTKTYRFNEKSYTLSGQWDYYDSKWKILVDVKDVKSIIPKFLPYAQHIEQVNLYAHLARSIGLEVKRLECHYFDASHSHIVSLPMWSEEECMSFIEKHLVPLADAIEKSELPEYKKILKCSRCEVSEKCHAFVRSGA